MTEKRTLALNPRQWRVLLNDNLDLLKNAVHQTETLNEDGLKQFYAQLDDMKMLATAWFQVGAPKVQESVIHDIRTVPPVRQEGPPPKKRRGRPSLAELAARAVQ